MMRMTRQINTDYVDKVNEHGTSVTCYTCHRGKVTPDSTLPAPPEGQGGGAPPAPQPHG